jgi:hypothetical protein
MATTTPNFGWAVPTSTDLVKDGAVAIETLGDSIDASLVDLKGGTSGQVLKKNSNTDMDFIWSADSAGMTNPMTTTGDTIYSSSGSTPARLGIGTTGQVLTVASGVPSWATPAVSSSGLTLVRRSTFTSVANTGTTFDTIFNATYKTYMIVVETISAATSVDDIRVQFRNGSSTISGANYYGANFGVQYNGSTIITNNTNGVGHIILTADSDAGTTVTMYANNVGGTTSTASLRGTGHEQAKPVATCFSAGYFASVNVDGLIFSSASSNISGTVAIYGLAI